ncbi:hypothetical protein NBRC110019_07640 [Neptunitalea chrysea]|uniref:Uncharacterized protein n=1 Tax=Neptunitalea chrysea TaxID=1647581 RepID=A0A9W6ETC5_9FLAO|nr:hypothetical protein [Neptunitalea chrysea]GLB51725.1 hypothetical protein NBRC110019_07640 [Neptunitalea chrysea]
MEKAIFLSRASEALKMILDGSLKNLPDFYDLDSGIDTAMIKTEEEVIKEVIANYTKRPFSKANDTPKITRVFHQSAGYAQYILCYDNVQLGMISKKMIGNNYTVQFNPNEFKFDL